jgi:mannose-6-phosphate isomerase-like protein (cupin superfamily)
MSFSDLAILQLEELRPGILFKAGIEDNLIMVCMQIVGSEMEDTGHVHPFDQCGVVLEGQIEMFAGKSRQVLTANECYFIPAGELHGWKTFSEPVKILDMSLKTDIRISSSVKQESNEHNT